MCSTLSKTWLLRSHHIVQSKQAGIKFQILEWCFPNQFLQPNSKFETLLGRTHIMPIERNTKLHKPLVNEQCNNKWLVDSPEQQHKQHHPAKWYPLRIRLSIVKILSHVADQTKNATQRGICTLQVAFLVILFLSFPLFKKILPHLH